MCPCLCHSLLSPCHRCCSPGLLLLLFPPQFIVAMMVVVAIHVDICKKIISRVKKEEKEKDYLGSIVSRAPVIVVSAFIVYLWWWHEWWCMVMWESIDFQPMSCDALRAGWNEKIIFRMAYCVHNHIQVTQHHITQHHHVDANNDNTKQWQGQGEKGVEMTTRIETCCLTCLRSLVCFFYCFHLIMF